jgi:FtsH ternary system domain X5
MSRAYRITVRESVTREVRGSDEISTQLELLDILPPEATNQLLRESLKRRGFEEQPDGTLARTDGDVTVRVDPCSGEVTVRAEATEDVTLKGSKDATGWDDAGPNSEAASARARQELLSELDKRMDKENARLQAEATAALEKHLQDLQPEIGQVVNEVTRESLKQKAAQLGTITDISEDAASGSMTIQVEV